MIILNNYIKPKLNQEKHIADKLIDDFKAFKEQDKRTTGVGTNLNNPMFEDCDLEFVQKFLSKQGFNSYIEEDKRNHKFIYIYPAD